MLSERTIINGLVLIAGMILGPYLITLTFELNQVALLSFSCIVGLFVVFFFFKDRISVGPFMAGYFGGSLNFLPFGLTPVEITSMVVIFYYLIHHVALKRKSPIGGPRFILLPMLVIGAIVLYHDHQISLHALGGSEQGSRPGLLILLALVAYLCAINIPSPSATFLGRLPLYCLLLTAVGSLPFLLTTYFPSLAPYVYYVSGNINLAAYIESTSGGDASDTGRNGSFLGVATTLQGILLAYYPLSTWWRPSRWILILFSGFCLYGVLISGYRNALFSLAMVVFLSAVCYSGWRILLALPLFILIPLSLLFVQSSHIGGLSLPTTVQRTMSFIPGDWDPDVEYSASNSNEFRADITRVYKKEELRKSPLLGNGFAFDPRESESYEALAHTGSASDSSYYESKAFIVSKNFHVGWISLYDAVGIIGGIAFVALAVSLIWISGQFIFQHGVDVHSPLFPVKVWIFCSLVTGTVGYFATFGSFNSSFVGYAGTAVVLFHLHQIERRQALRKITPTPPMALAIPSGAQEFFPISSPTK